MKRARPIFSQLLFLVLISFSAYASTPAAGFFLPDSVSEMTLSYRTVKGLIVLPVTINDTVKVNLILDTGCRNLILFGRKFRNDFTFNGGKPVVFSGLGAGRPVTGKLSLGNTVSIESVLGQQIPVVVVTTSDLFEAYHKVDGVIGYDIFLKFEIELNARAQTITFRPAQRTVLPHGYEKIPLRIVDSRPVLQSKIFIGKNEGRILDLMIDTGSSLGLLLKTTNISEYDHYYRKEVLGIGLNGPLSGYETISKRLVIRDLEMEDVPTGIVSSAWHNNASIGMAILKDYVLVLNYCQSYACFKRNDA